MAEQACYTLINTGEDFEPPSEAELRKKMENPAPDVKVEALKGAIGLLMQGEKLPSILMTVIRFVMPCEDHYLKKLLLIFWEIVPKYGPDGKLLHEMILVCDAYRKDLQHPNEYVRGSTLRFLCKLKEPELLEPLMPSIRDCLKHRHSYVRRNAVLAIYTIFKSFDFLIPDAPELVSDFLEQEQDASCKRNAFMMLITVDQKRALDYLSTCIDQVQTFNEILQLVIVELVHRVCRSEPAQRSRFIKVIYNLLDSTSPAVRYDAAGTLLTLSAAPTAVSAAAKCYINLIVKESDNSVKLIVLDRLVRLRENPSNERVLQDLAMDMLRVLAAPDLEVRRKTVDLVLDLVSNRNVGEIVGYLQKELAKTNSQEQFERSAEYRQVLVRALHTCGVKYPEIAPTIVPQLMEFLSDEEAGEASAMDVILFVREAFERLPELHSEMLGKLLDSYNDIKVAKVLRATTWIVGEYSRSYADVSAAMDKIKLAVGPLPILDTELKEAAELEAQEEEEDKPQVMTRTRITADGTYATESVYTAKAEVKLDKRPLRRMLLDGEFFVGTSVAAAMTKLALRFREFGDVPTMEKNKFAAQCMLIMTSMLHLGRSNVPAQKIDNDSFHRIMSCVRVLANPTEGMVASFEAHCHEAFVEMLNVIKKIDESSKDTKKGTKAVVQPDDLITFKALMGKEQQLDDDDDVELNITRATGASDEKEKLTSKLSKVIQLSGFSDPVFAEAYVDVNQYDILLDVLVVNQTADTLQNLTLELATLGDLKLTEKPQAHTVGPHDFCNIRANVKVTSTETGIIFGNIVYDVSGATSDRNCVVLNDIHIDIMDYILPGRVSDVDFRNMWAEFEWENKVAVRTTITDLREYLNHLMNTTNMSCLTPELALQGDCDFLAANLYARSVFGEDALANISIEKLADGQITGHVRIRSKSQGIALSLGDKITLHQRGDDA